LRGVTSGARVIWVGKNPLYMLKLSPHEQLALAFGLENLNPPATNALE
jgi:hypothetical protein